MKKIALLCMLILCSNFKKTNDEFVISFGSCNKQYTSNDLWPEIAKNNPSVWIWGGDNVYSDTDNMSKLRADYQLQ